MKDLGELNIRFLEALAELGITGYKMHKERIINSQATLTKIKQGLQQPSRDTIDKLCSIYPISKVWLLTGEGPMLKSQPADQTVDHGVAVATVGSPRAKTIINHNNHNNKDMESMSTEIQTLVEQCRAANENAAAMLAVAKDLMNMANKTMQSAIDLQRDMKNDHQQTLGLYDKMYAIQKEHIERSRDWIGDSIDNIRTLRSDIKKMIDEQTKEQQQERDADTSRIIKLFTHAPEAHKTDIRSLRKEA